MSGEWKACDTMSGVTFTPSCSNFDRNAESARPSPETTTLSGPLTAAIASSARQGASSGVDERLVGQYRRHRTARAAARP